MTANKILGFKVNENDMQRLKLTLIIYVVNPVLKNFVIKFHGILLLTLFA